MQTHLDDIKVTKTMGQAQACLLIWAILLVAFAALRHQFLVQANAPWLLPCWP